MPNDQRIGGHGHLAPPTGQLRGCNGKALDMDTIPPTIPCEPETIGRRAHPGHLAVELSRATRALVEDDPRWAGMTRYAKGCALYELGRELQAADS